MSPAAILVAVMAYDDELRLGHRLLGSHPLC